MRTRIDEVKNKIAATGTRIAARTAPARSNPWESYAPVWEEHAQAWEEMGEGRRTKTNPTSKSKGNYILRVISVNAGFLDVIGHTGIAVFETSNVNNYEKYYFYNAGGNTRYSDEAADEHGVPIYSKENPDNVIDLEPNTDGIHDYRKTMMNYLAITEENIILTDWQLPTNIAEKLIDIIQLWNIGTRDNNDIGIFNCADDCRKMIIEAYVECNFSLDTAKKRGLLYIPSSLPKLNEMTSEQAKKSGAVGVYRHFVNDKGDLDIIEGASDWEEEGVYDDLPLILSD